MKRGLECKQGFTEIFHEIVNFRWKIRQNALCYLNINKVSRFFSWNCHGLGFYYSRNRHSWRHIGHKCWVCWVCNHFIMQWMWKQWVQAPQTSGQSSPGLLQSGQQPSKATLKKSNFLKDFTIFFNFSWVPANSTSIIVGDPFPRSNAVPAFDCDF